MITQNDIEKAKQSCYHLYERYQATMAGQLNDDVLERQGKFEPQYYIILDYSGQHYQLITYKEKSAFTFSDLPEQVKKLIKNKCLFIAQ